MAIVADLVAYFSRFAPPATAATWDNVGLLIGDRAGPASRILTCLTITPNVVAEAVAENVDAIVSHHPVLFRGVKTLSSETSEGRLLLPLLRAGIAVYSPHTAFDDCCGGINDDLCERLGLIDVKPLRVATPSEFGEYKLVVFVPESDLTTVADALFAAGAGKIGNYDQCSFRTPGTGTFFSNDAAKPAIGQKGQREDVAEFRLEVVVPKLRVEQVVAALRQSHRYEEPAYDLYPLYNPNRTGTGRVGKLPTPQTLESLVQFTARALSASAVQFVGSPERNIARVAIACGAAGEYLPDAIRENADVFLTGEVRFHDALSAEAANIALILPGHYATERPAIERLATRLQNEFPQAKVWPSQSESDPLQTRMY